MDFESPEPPETRSRVHGVRFVQKLHVREKVWKRDKKGSQHVPQNGAKSSPWALLGLTLAILEGLWRRSIFDAFFER